MKLFVARLILTFLIISLFQKTIIGQCTISCPSVFTMRDSINCNTNVDIMRNNPGPGYSNRFSLVRSCQNTLMKYYIDVNQTCYAGTTYNFLSISGGTFISLSGNSFTILWGAANSGQVQIAFTTPGNPGLAPCSDIITINFSLVPKPVAAFTAAPQPVCNLLPTSINFNSSATTNGNNFFWNFGDSYTSNIQNPLHSYSSPGTYTVTMYAANNAFFNGNPVCPTCIDSVKHNITIDVLPPPEIKCVATVCAGDIVQYCAADNTCSGYIWTATGGVIQSGQGTSCVTIQWGSGNPQGIINLVASGCATPYCASGATVTVPIIPATGTISGPVLVCNNTIATYTLPSWPGTTYSWSLGSGGFITPYNTNTNQININWNTIGDHMITCSYFDTSLNCGGIASYIVKVRPNLSISGPATVCQGQTTNLNTTMPTNIPVPTNWSINPTTAVINSGNGTPTINVTWPTVGSYLVTASPVVPNTTCDNANYTVTVLPNPVISSINGPDSICAGSTHVYSATSTLSGTFSWTINNAASFNLLGANNDSVQVTWGTTGPYNISVSQTSNPFGCPSNTLLKNVFLWPTPALSGPVSVCADAVVSYTITNILNANLQWAVSPANFGTIQSGQGTNTVTILWHGNNSPGTSNIVYLKYGVCGEDSVAITINEPVIPVITASGTLCGPGGITLSTGATGVFTWAGPGGPIPGNTPSITGINIPGNYTVQIQNFNGSGCTVNTNYNIPDVGRPVASISADNVLYYCFPNLPNMNLVAVNSPGYTFQWYQAPSTLLVGQTSATLPINTLTSVGTYSFYCVVTLGSCVVTSNTITIVITNCSGGGCSAAINVTGITGCNPFNLAIAATAPSGAVLNGSGNPTIEHLEDNYIVSGLTTRTYTSIGYKQIKVCADVLLPDASICRVCKDTVVHVNVAPNFTSVVNCNIINLFDASTVVFPAVINAYNWSVGTNPGNTPVLPPIATFNNNAIASPTLTFTQSGSYIVNLTITSGSCTITVRDTFNISVPDANFTLSNSCVGTPVAFNDPTSEPTHFWDFGDASTSYVNPTSHAYSAAGTYSVTHIVTDINGCKDTLVKAISIVAAPVCTVTLSGPATFCSNSSITLGSSCSGLVGYQWYNNGAVVIGATNSTHTVSQTGNYHFTAQDINGCFVNSDTAAINVLQGPNVSITTSGKACDQNVYTVSVPNCTGCTYQWEVDGVPTSTSNIYSAFVGFAPYTLGTHIIKITVIDPSTGCTDINTISVTFNALPSLSISVAGPLPVCSNNLYTLTASSNAANPGWIWNFNNSSFILGTTNTLNASADGTYTVSVLDSTSGCRRQASQIILQSPFVNLFPVGCDTLCDTSKVYMPLASFNGDLSGYTIDWYNNAPPYATIIGSGVSFPLSSLPLGNHNLSVIVTSPNGCKDTSNVYSINIKNCHSTLPIIGLNISARQTGNLALVGWSVEQEIDNDHFIVEKSYNGNDFFFIKKVISRGNSSTKQFYDIIDSLNNSSNVIYYRVTAVSILGSVQYSPIVKLKPVLQNAESILLYPNVAKNDVNVLIQSSTTFKSKLQIYSANGLLVYSREQILFKGLNKLKVNVGNLPSGLYIVTINTNSTKLFDRLIKH